MSGSGFNRTTKDAITSREWTILITLVLTSLLSPFLANDIPLYCQKEGRHHFPVFSRYLPGLFPNAEAINWPDHQNWGDHYILPPIPYHSRTIDLKNAPFLDPFEGQDIPSLRWRHWLGTDDLGRDVLAGLLHGSTISLLTGLFASMLAMITGILIGGFAGFFGDRHFRPGRAHFLAWGFSVVTATLFGLAWLDAGLMNLGKLILLVTMTFLVAWLFGNLLNQMSWMKKRVTLPADLAILRIIETIRSIPDLFLIIGIAAIFRQPGWINLVLLIAFLRWPVVARYVRAEMLKIRDQDYIMYARGTGLPPSRVFWRHALPNALTPVWVLGAFSVAIAILLESSLSFLGIGIPPEWVTWGSMLNLSRRSLEAWHMAVFPGLAMFAVIYYFNYLGEKMEAVLRSTRREG